MIRPDITSLKMAYEAARDQFLGWYENSRAAKASDDIPPHLRGTYERARRQGMRDAMSFGFVEPAAAPLELDGQFSAAWEQGYEDGRFFGRDYGLIFLKEVVG